MQEVIAHLVKLQSMDSRIAEINSVVSNTPSQMQAIKDRLDKAISGHKVIGTALETNKKEYLQLEKDLNERKELFANSQKKLMTVQNNKEYQSVLREQDNLKKTIDDSDKTLKEMLSANYGYESELASITELRDGLELELSGITSEKREEDKELHAELEVLVNERAEQATKISKVQLSKYDRIRGYRKNIAVAKVKNEVCNGCYMHLPPQLYVDVKKDAAIYSCPYCQRILYYQEEEEVSTEE